MQERAQNRGFDMRIGILIAVRMKSTRLPRKALAMIEGQTLIEHLIDRVKTAEEVDEVILCTSTHKEDEILTKYADKKGIKWFRGEEDDVLKRFIDCADGEKLDIIVRVTGDNPLTDPVVIDGLIRSHIEKKADYSVMEGLPMGITGEVVSVSALKKVHELAKDPENTEYMTNYLRDPKHLKLNIMQADEGIRRPEYRLTVDTQKDIELIRKIYNVLYKNKRIFSLHEVIRLLDSRPDLSRLNIEIKQRKKYERNKDRK